MKCIQGNMTIGEIVDKYTILIIKLEKGLPIGKELSRLSKTIPTSADSSALYEINKKMWRLEELIGQETDIEKIGAFYLALRWMGVRRNEEKNKLNEQFGDVKELKLYK